MNIGSILLLPFKQTSDPQDDPGHQQRQAFQIGNLVATDNDADITGANQD